LAIENLEEEKNNDKDSIFPKQQAFDPKQIEPFVECNQHPSTK